MKKSQLRANLLDDNSTFIQPGGLNSKHKSNSRVSSHNHNHNHDNNQNQGPPPPNNYPNYNYPPPQQQQPMHYMNHPLAQNNYQYHDNRNYQQSQHQSYPPQQPYPPQQQSFQQQPYPQGLQGYGYPPAPQQGPQQVPPQQYIPNQRESTIETQIDNYDRQIDTDKQDKIQLLEEKIQRLEKVLAMQQLEEEKKLEERRKTEVPSMPIRVPTPPQPIRSNNGSVSSLNSGPPLPPPPPPQKLNTSSKNSLIIDNQNDMQRLSASSLIPTEKSIEDEETEIDDEEEEDEEDGDNNGDEPPPSYEELEKSGTLTYSQSIYRTGFEKAGYQMDHVTPSMEKDSKKLEALGLNDNNDDKNSKFELDIKPPTMSVNSLNKPIVKAERLMSKRKIPTQIEEERKPELVKKPTDESINSTIYNPRVKSEIIGYIKYSTNTSYETLANGVIKPILPSKSDESIDNVINRFRKTREKALNDYKQFTPKIQFYWAILLLETLSKSDVISKMTIDGKIRKNEISFKKLRKQRLMFLNTAVKVLEKLIQIAPNDTRAKLYLGDIYSGGIHPGLIERDEVKGYKLFYDCATKQNDPVGCYRVACCLESGIGCEKDINKSIIFFEKGANLGDPSSMCQLGMMHFAGVNGCLQDIKLSILYHKQAYETLRSVSIMGFDPLISTRSFQDARGALYTLAKLHQTDKQILCLTNLQDEKTLKTINELKNNNVWCNKSKTLKYYLESAKLGHNESQACLGYYYSQGYFPTYLFKSDKESNLNGEHDLIDSRKSIYWFSKAAADGHTYASLGLARWYGSGAIDENGKIILKKDEQQAFLWGRKAADGGELVEAEFMIGICFEQGFGVEKNLIMAQNYYERSARKGYKKAIIKLKTLNKLNK